MDQSILPNLVEERSSDIIHALSEKKRVCLDFLDCKLLRKRRISVTILSIQMEGVLKPATICDYIKNRD